MSYPIQRSLVVVLASTALYFGFFWAMSGPVAAAPDGPLELFRLWATGFLVFIPVYVATLVVIFVVFAVVRAVVTREENLPVSDELERLIGLRAARNSGIAGSLALVAALAAVVLGGGVSEMFVTLVAGLYLSGLIAEATQIVLYSRGV